MHHVMSITSDSFEKDVSLKVLANTVQDEAQLIRS